MSIVAGDTAITKVLWVGSCALYPFAISIIFSINFLNKFSKLVAPISEQDREGDRTQATLVELKRSIANL
jgi:hypothetical protein